MPIRLKCAAKTCTLYIVAEKQTYVTVTCRLARMILASYLAVPKSGAHGMVWQAERIEAHSVSSPFQSAIQQTA